MSETDHVQWMRRQAGLWRKAAEEGAEPKQAQKLAKLADRLFAAAGSMEAALAGVNADVMAGNRAVAMALSPGKSVRVVLMQGAELRGQMGTIGRYDFLLTTDDGRRLVVPKHAVLYWELVEGTVEEGQGGQPV